MGNETSNSFERTSSVLPKQNVICNDNRCDKYNARALFSCENCSKINEIEGLILRKYLEAMDEETARATKFKLLGECKNDLDMLLNKRPLIVELINKTIGSGMKAIESQDIKHSDDSSEEEWIDF